jgi:hypothetical protein
MLANAECDRTIRTTDRAKPGWATKALGCVCLVLTNKVDDDGVELSFQFLLWGSDVHDGTAREGSVDVCGSLLGRGAAER